MKCTTCEAELGDCTARAGFLCYEVMGDEYIESIWRCGACGHYTAEIYHDHFMGEDTVHVGTMSAEDGAARVALFARCPSPDHKRCRCPVHGEVGV